jgi:spermidine dehydrogenase
LRDLIKGYWGIGYDALSAMEGFRLGMPGTWYLGLVEESHGPGGREEPYIFHFPDGNAGVARSIVRQLIPEAVPGSTMEDLVLSRVDYELLDLQSNPTRIRLDSTAVDVRHVDGDKAVDVTYVQNGNVQRIRGKHAILACYNNIVPHICPEVSVEQRAAIAKATKIPLVYISVAVRNWKAFEKLGFQSFYIPQPKLMHSFGMDFPVSMGGYDFTRNSSEPTIVHGTYVPTAPDQGLSEREQHVQGRRDLYAMTFDDLERDIVGAMSGALEGGGFDAERDVAGLTVNRWPHGYAYEYNELFDPHDWSPENGPHLLGAAQIGRISIANSDASAFAFVNGAFDAAHRAVNEQIGMS